ncbi:Do family serine endopeptidase [Hyphobacterium marinum]|uniref:Probable periplasmic serine endoprotease DegP-like n=1 Tax=Hyphobacterium marinum TaxID=3116574 RepID=A0ABU7LZJ6_9PROT|nr:Do family serine endopeptidase [Hyphobacterium sp. Y6023]MEE2566964.1 Do family serine endopeptidase [Hyphobacterium sp. Y6023]
MRVFLAFFAILLVSGAAHAQRFPSEGFADLNERLSPAVVNISAAQRVGGEAGLPAFPEGSPLERFNQLFGDDAPRIANSLGSGFVIDPDGVVVTNNHVIDEADEVEVTFPDGRTFPAEIVGRDPATDLAVLRIQSDDPFPHVSFGDSDAARVGDWVIAIGNPFGLGGSLTAGVISARGRDAGGQYDDYIQTDVAINTGNSGGPLFNLDGEVVGVNTLIYSPTGASVGISFSIPSAIAEPVVSQLLEFGETRRGWLGVNVRPVNAGVAEALGLGSPRGAVISAVDPDGPAAAAGIQQGDVVLRFDGRLVPDSRSLPRFVAETEIGRRVEIVLNRRGQSRTVTATVERLEEEGAPASTPRTATQTPVNGGEVAGLTLAVLDDASRRRWRVHADAAGVLVTAVDPTSDAAGKVRAGDVIEEVAFTRVETIADVRRLVGEANGEPVLFTLNRGGQFVLQTLEP